MTADAFRAKLKALGLSQVGAAKRLGIDPRTVRRYASGDLSVTALVELALEGLIRDGSGTKTPRKER